MDASSSPAPTTTSPDLIAPEALLHQGRAHAVADLALKIAASDLETTTQQAHLIDKAVWQAEQLLAAAEGRHRREVHAFQLFRPEDGFMTFKEVAERFKECSWPGQMNSETSVREAVQSILQAARKTLREEIARGSTRREWKLVPIRRSDIEHRVERLLRAAFRRWRLDDLDDDFEKVKDRISGEISFILNPHLTPPGWRPPRHELSMTGYGSFAAYALEPPDFGRFLRDPQLELDRDDLLALAAFFTDFEKDKMGPLLPVIAEVIRKALGIPPRIAGAVAKCVDLARSKKTSAELRRSASSTAKELRELVAARRCDRIISNLRATPLVEQLDDWPEHLRAKPVDWSSRVGLLAKQLHEAVDHAKKHGRPPDIKPLREPIKSMLEALESAAAGTEQISEGLRWASQQLDDCEEELPAPPPKQVLQRLNNLRDQIDPSEHRRFRAHEVFLFAAQAKLSSDKLTSPSKKVPMESLLSPPRPFDTEPSILIQHPGVPPQ